MKNKLIDDLERLVREVWEKSVREDFPKKAYYEADLVASFYHHLRTSVEEKGYKVRLGLERPVRRPKGSGRRNDLHIISAKGEGGATLIAFEFKCRPGVERKHLGHDRKKLKDLRSRGVKRGYMCMVDLAKKSENNVEGENVQISRPAKKWEKGFYREAYGTRDGNQKNLWRIRLF